MFQASMLGLIQSAIPYTIAPNRRTPPPTPRPPPPTPALPAIPSPSILSKPSFPANPPLSTRAEEPPSPPAQPSTTSNTMPRLSRTPSPLDSPAIGPTYTAAGGTKPVTPTTSASMAAAPLAYIPPLRDGACGTTPRSQQPLWTVLRQEMAQTLRVMPTLGWALLTQRCRHASWANTASTVLHFVLACLEVGIMLMAVPLWVMLPGGVFGVWLGVCAGVVWAMCWVLNGREQMHQCSAGSEGWMMGQEGEDEKWLFLGGMGMSSRHCHKKTLPALSRLFSRPMVCICMPTYGMPFDMVAMMLQRCMPIPSQARRNLYSQMRCALLDESLSRCVILAHNDSAVIVSQAVAKLCSDLPLEKLSKLEIYTFGAAASEFMIPLGEVDVDSEPARRSGGATMEHRGIHVEHFTMTNDLFGQLGVLRSVRQNMESRFCGGVFIMNNMPTSTSKTKPMCSGLVMEEYLMALFPSQMTDGDSPRSVLDNVMTIDRGCAEKREIAAMSNYHAASQAKRGKRLSWTGLATMAGQQNGMNAGMVALEMARKGCRTAEGRRGREVSWLMRYVANVSQGGASVNGTQHP